MILWIVEDQRKEAERVLKDIQASFPGVFDIYINRDIDWPEGSTLPQLEPAVDMPSISPRQPRSWEYLPDIVVLDLLFADEDKAVDEWATPEGFPGAAFYKRLRDEEDNAHKRRSQVIVYSQYRGMAFTQHFVDHCRRTDNHFNDVTPKSPGRLVEKLPEAILKVRSRE